MSELCLHVYGHNTSLSLAPTRNQIVWGHLSISRERRATRRHKARWTPEMQCLNSFVAQGSKLCSPACPGTQPPCIGVHGTPYRGRHPKDHNTHDTGRCTWRDEEAVMLPSLRSRRLCISHVQRRLLSAVLTPAPETVRPSSIAATCGCMCSVPTDPTSRCAWRQANF